MSLECVYKAKEERGIARGGRGAKEVLRREVTASQLLGTVTCVRLGVCSVRLRLVFSRVVILLLPIRVGAHRAEELYLPHLTLSLNGRLKRVP